MADALRASRRLLVTAHPDPDGDALGSTAAAAVALAAPGRVVVAYNPDPVPRKLAFIPGTELLVRDLPAEPFDTTLLLDCSDDRVLRDGRLTPVVMGRLVVIDHHKTPASLGDVVLQDPSAAAVGVLLFKLFRFMGIDPAPVAEALFCSVMSDTGSFRYQNTNREAMEVAGELLEMGVCPWTVASALYETRPLGELRLLGEVLGTLVVSPDGRLAALTVTPEMLAASGCRPEDTDGLINYARAVDGVEVAMLLRVREVGVRVSMRSRGRVDVAAIAERFGGGGHHNAAGCTLQMTAEEARRALFALAGPAPAGGA